MEEDERNEWGPKGQPSASEQLKISGYTEETEYPEPNWEANIQNELSKPKNQQLNSGIAANDPLVDSLLLASPLLAKPALMKGLMIGGGNLIKKYPLKALEVGLTGLGASDYKDNPQDLVLETLGMKTDTMVSGGKRGPFNPVANLGIKKLGEIFDDVLSEANSIFNRKLAGADGINIPFLKSENLGGFGKEANKKIFDIQQGMRPKTNQLGLFANQSDYELLELYKSQNKTLPSAKDLDTLISRKQAKRALRPSDFDDIIAEFPEITPDHIFGYISDIHAGRSGTRKLNPATNRWIGNQKGLEGTLRFLNAKAAPNPNFDLAEIAAELSAEFNKTITPADISNMIKGNVKGGVISFKTQGMKQPMQIKSIADLRKAYMARVARYQDIPAFERGHVFAADNIIKDRNIKSLTDFKNNLEPEIARSIYRQLDDEALTELIRANVDNNFDNIESLYEQVLAGNRSRKNLDEPDKIIAQLYGRDYGLRESFLSYVYPERSLNRLIPSDLKAAFTDLYKKELDSVLRNFEDLRAPGSKGLYNKTVGPYMLDQIKNKVAIDVLKSFGPDQRTRDILEQLTLMSDKGYGKDMVDYISGEAF